MSILKTIELKRDDYSFCVLIQAQESLHELKPELDRNISCENMQGKILFDTLFHAGNADDRFFEIETENGRPNWETLKTALVKKQDNIRKKSCRGSYGEPRIIRSINSY
ncbi:type II toxin-antitoxin system RnlB family antitoxin [Bacillus subtilis subsp. subtilis]